MALQCEVDDDEPSKRERVGWSWAKAPIRCPSVSTVAREKKTCQGSLSVSIVDDHGVGRLTPFVVILTGGRGAPAAT